MLYYPQLSTGSVSQFPVSRRMEMRVFSNKLLDGGSIRMADTGVQTVQWQLQYTNLSDAEALVIQQLFDATEGRLSTFTFLDPTDNLLMWSDDWTQAVWTADHMLQITTGLPDPFGSTNAMQITNAGQANQRVIQVTGGPSGFQYCYSVYLRSNSAGTVQIVVSASGQDLFVEIPLRSTWTRVAVPTCLPVQGDGISFGLQLPPGSSVDACGAQAEAQTAAGAYKKTIDRGGVYPTTRFNADSLLWTTTAPDQNSCELSLISNLT